MLCSVLSSPKLDVKPQRKTCKLKNTWQKNDTWRISGSSASSCTCRKTYGRSLLFTPAPYVLSAARSSKHSYLHSRTYVDVWMLTGTRHRFKNTHMNTITLRDSQLFFLFHSWEKKEKYVYVFTINMQIFRRGDAAGWRRGAVGAVMDGRDGASGVR